MTLKQLFRSEAAALRNAKLRCHNPDHNAYVDYGGRGITVCDEWSGKLGFYAFLDEIGPKPSPELTLDRIDNDKGYQPKNVRWATRSEQMINRRPHWLKRQARLAPRNEWIRSLRDDGQPAREIARQSGLSIAQVNRILADLARRRATVARSAGGRSLHDRALARLREGSSRWPARLGIAYGSRA